MSCSGSLRRSYHIVVPSLPGYGFSSAPSRPGFDAAEIASTLNSLMLALGYDHYVAQGVSTHNLHADVFPQSNWPVAGWPWLVAYICPHFVHKFTKYANMHITKFTKYAYYQIYQICKSVLSCTCCQQTGDTSNSSGRSFHVLECSLHHVMSCLR